MLQGHIASRYRQFDRPDEWFDALSPYFVGARFAQRSREFSVAAHFGVVAGTSLFDIDIHQSGLRPGQYGFSIDRVATHRYVALWQARGSASVKQAHQVVDLAEGEWALFEADLASSFCVQDASRCIGLMIPERDNRWAELIGPGGRSLSRSAGGDIAAALMVESLSRSSALDQRVQRSCENLMLDLLDSALEGCSPPCGHAGRLPLKLRQADDLILAQIGNTTLRPDDIGRAIGVSRRALYRLFRQIGHTPMSYIRQQRLQEAARRLRDASAQDLSITRIAYDLGFADPAHFSRLFRAQFGASPRQWGARARDR